MAALDPRERAGRAGIEHRDPHVSGNLIEPIPQRAIRIAILPEQEALLVGVAGVVQQHLGAAAARRAPRLEDSRGDPVEGVDDILEPRLAQDDRVGGAHAAELDQDLREALGVGDRVLETRPLGAAEVRANHQREPLHAGLGGDRRRQQPRDASIASAGDMRRADRFVMASPLFVPRTSTGPDRPAATAPAAASADPARRRGVPPR